jgi:hypothetical protein
MSADIPMINNMRKVSVDVCIAQMYAAVLV